MISRKTKIFIAIVAIFFVLVLSNPSEKWHRQAEWEYINKIHADNLVPYEKATVERMLYHNCIIFSFTIDPGQKCLYGQPVTTIGICGKVFVVPESDGYG